MLKLEGAKAWPITAVRRQRIETSAKLLSQHDISRAQISSCLLRLCVSSHKNAGSRTTDAPLIPKEQLPWLVISVSVALIYTADRTGYWLKEHKQFNPWTFTFLCILSLAVGLLTVKRADSDQGILNRDQTDEWKGWMQSKPPMPSKCNAGSHRHFSCYSDIPLPRSIQDFRNLQPNPRACRIISLHDRLRSCRVLLHQE